MLERVILRVKPTMARAPDDLSKAVGGFLRYIQYRDEHDDPAAPCEVSGLLKYVSYRDRTGSRGRTFGPGGSVGDDERRDLARFVGRSIRDSRPQLAPDSGGRLVDRRRAVHRFVLSPEFAEGLDLRQLAQVAMGQLQSDMADPAPLRWLAAEHRNTAHPHVHIVLAGMSEPAPGRFRSVIISKPRLARMKAAIAQEVERQRGGQLRRAADAKALGETTPSIAPLPEPISRRIVRPQSKRPAARRRAHWRGRSQRQSWVALSLRRLARGYQLEAERQAAEERRRGLAGERSR